MSRQAALATAALWFLVGGVAAGAEATLPDPGVIATAEITLLSASALDDEDVKAAVTSALEMDPALAGSTIEVASVEDGVVLLTGETGTFASHLRAIGTASRVSGVREVRTRLHGAIEPTPIEPNEKDDGFLVDPPDARARLGLDDGASHLDRPRLEPARLGPGVTVAADTVEEVVTGVASAAGSGMVRATQDAWITAATKTALLANPEVPALDVNVDTVNRVVTLFGIVPSRTAKYAATRSAGGIAGVRAVDNALEVVPAATQERVAVEDEEVHTHVSRALERSRMLQGEDISIDVKNGVARLTGHVSENVERVVASSVVRATPGVRAVNNDLRVASE